MVKNAELAPGSSFGSGCKLISCCVEGHLGDRVQVWRWAHVMEDAQIADDCVIAQCVFVHREAKIGRGSRILNGACISEGAVIGERVYVGPNVVFANARHPKFDPSERVHLPIVVGSDVMIGANAVILGGVTIGDGASIGACAVVTKDVPPGVTVKGVPAR